MIFGKIPDSNLVGDWWFFTNPFEKIWSPNSIISPRRGKNKPPPSNIGTCHLLLSTMSYCYVLRTWHRVVPHLRPLRFSVDPQPRHLFKQLNKAPKSPPHTAISPKITNSCWKKMTSSWFFTNPSEKNMSKSNWIMKPQGSGENTKCLKTPPRWVCGTSKGQLWGNFAKRNLLFQLTQVWGVLFNICLGIIAVLYKF